MKRYFFILSIFLPLGGLGQSSLILSSSVEPVLYNGKVCIDTNYKKFFSVNYSVETEFTITLRGTSGETILYNWGDGNKELITFDGTLQAISHTYSSGTFRQRIVVNTDHVTYLSAINQGITGEIPYALSNFYNITLLNISNNSITGDISSWATELANWTSIQYFYVHGNSLTGDLSGWSTAIANWTGIIHFYLYQNSFTGDLSGWSTAIANWTNIAKLFIFSNSFTGDLSSWSTAIANWTNILDFRINDNSFTGDLSSWSTAFAYWTKIINIYIQTNSFTGIAATQSTTISLYYAQINSITSSTQIDNLFVNLDTYFTSNTPVKNLTIDVSGGTNAAPTATGTAAISSLESTFTAAGYTFTAITN